MPYYTEYNFPDHKSGDTFLGVIFRLTDGNTVPIDLDGATIDLHTLSPTEEHLTTENGGITVIDDSAAVEGKFMVNEQVIDWEPANYEYEIIITFLSGAKRTYIVGYWLIVS